MFHAAFDFFEEFGSKFQLNEIRVALLMINDGVQFAFVCSFFEIHPHRKETT